MPSTLISQPESTPSVERLSLAVASAREGASPSIPNMIQLTGVVMCAADS